MRDQHNRDILFYDVRISSDPPTRQIIKMSELAAFIVTKKNHPETTYVTRNNAKKITVLDASIDEKHSALKVLIRVNNLHGSHAAFANWSTGEQRVEEKREGEGRPETCHILISLNEDANNSNRYAVLFEASNLLKRYFFQVYINHLLRAFRRANKSRFEMKDPDGSKKEGKDKTIRFKCKANVAGHLSTEVIETLQQGGLTGAFFETDDRTNMGFGEGALVTPVRKQVKLSMEGNVRGQAMTFLKNAFRVGARNGYEHLRITFKTGDRHAQAVLDTGTGELASEGFIKKESLSATNTSLPEASVDFEEILIARMFSLLRLHRAA